MPTDKKIVSQFKQDLGQGESDDFVFPVAPPTPSSDFREESFPADPTNTSGNSDPIPDSNFVNSNRENEQVPQRGADERHEKTNGSNLPEADSLTAWDNDTAVPEILEVAIDDRPMVAAVLVLLAIGSTIFLGWIMFFEGLPFFLIPLLVIYAITYDFFRKRMIRIALRQKNVERIDQPQ